MEKVGQAALLPISLMSQSLKLDVRGIRNNLFLQQLNQFNFLKSQAIFKLRKSKWSASEQNRFESESDSHQHKQNWLF